MERFRIKWFGTLLLWAFAFGGLTAQQFVANVQKFGLSDGLSSYNLHGGLIDKKGYYWFSSDYGLNRFDGKDFKVYTKEENGLCHNNILFFTEDHKGHFWMYGGTQGEVSYTYCIFDPETEQFSAVEEYLGSAPPFDPKSTQMGESILGKVTFMEFVNAPEGIRCYEYDSLGMRFLFEIPRDNPLIQGRLCHRFYASGPNEYVLMTSALDDSEPQFLYLNRQGRLLRKWTCPESHPILATYRVSRDKLCIYCANGTDKWNVRFFEDGISKQVQDLQVLPEWQERFGIGNGLIYAFSTDSLRIFDETGRPLDKIRHGLGLKYVYHSPPSIDTQNNIWIQNDVSLYLISLVPKVFESEFYNPGYPTRVRGIAQSKRHGLFFAEFMKCWNRSVNGDWATFKAGIQNPLGLMVQDDLVWIGMEHHALGCYDTRTGTYQEFAVKATNSKRPATIVWMPYLAVDGTIWAGTNDGIYSLDRQLGQLVPLNDAPNALSGSTVYAFHTNAQGTWLCTTAGLFLVDLRSRKIRAQYGSDQTGDNFIPAQHIAHLYEDKDGSFWLATKGSGLLHWNPKDKSYKLYTPKSNGLSHNVLYAVYGDDVGNLWISSSNGLMRFDKEDGFVQTFLIEDGLPHNEFNTISHFQDANGRLYFGGQNGIVHFHPKDFNVNKKLTPLLLTECFKQDRVTDSLRNAIQEITQTGSISLEPSDKAILLKFALLDYHNSKNHQYCYKIEGYDQNWTYQNDNAVRISGLPYGNFQLLLRAKPASGGNWISYPMVIQVLVPKPFYLRWWFFVLAGLGVFALLFAGFNLRIRALNQRRRELEMQVAERTATIEADKQQIAAQSEELKALDRLKSQFFANISHELRTPLTLILGPLSYILDKPEKLEEEEIRKQLLVMQRNGKSLMQLIEEVLDLSKMDAQKLELHLEPTPVRLFFEQFHTLFIPQSRNQKIEFDIEFHLSSDDLTILLDRKKMEKVVNNFMSNALKFTPKGGNILLRVEELEDRLKLTVRDDGKGIPPSDLPHVFERYFQTKEIQSKSTSGGTGIGLALVHDFAALMGGRVDVESILGQGATFHFEWRKMVTGIAMLASHHERLDLDEDYPIDHLGTDFTVLVVEDNTDMRDYVVELLQHHFKVVMQSQNGAEALELLEQHGKGIDIIVSDVMMPEIDGFTLLKRVKAHPVWQQIPMILLTALAEDHDRLEALTLGVDDYLTKPFSSTELLVRTKNLLYNYHQRLLWQETEDGESDHDSEDSDGSLDQPETKNSESNPPRIREVDLRNLQKIQKHILDSIPEKIPDVNELADFAAISPRQLTRQIKRITGLTPGKFIREVQLQVAREQLEARSALSIKEVCYNAGFEQASTFSALFKKRFGISPSDYLSDAAIGF